MKRLNKFLVLVLSGVILTSGLVQAADLITAAELAKKLRDKNTIVVSCRTPQDYAKVHIPGAVNVYHMELYTEPASNGFIKSPPELAKYFGSKGISESKSIVLYDEGSGKYAGRVYWILKYLGAPDVKILDGQLPAWKAARKPLTGAATNIKPVTFTPKPDPNLIATTTRVRAFMNKPNVVIIDARSAAEYSGQDETDMRKGHIPGAINIEYKEVLTEDGKLKSPEALKTLFTSKGVTPDKEVMVYCKTSVRAGIEFFALKSVLNYPKVRVYDQAFYGWQSVASNPVSPKP